MPVVWRSAEVVPTPKISTPTDLSSDLSPIWLLLTAAKILESFVWKCVLQLVTRQLDHQQSWCLAGRSTLRASVSALRSWTVSLDAGQPVRTVFVFFRKMFDLVDHNVFLKKYSRNQFPSNCENGSNPFCTTVARVPGFPCSLKGGMPQGSLLGPISFVIHIDDLWLLSGILNTSITLHCQNLLVPIPLCQTWRHF